MTPGQVWKAVAANVKDRVAGNEGLWRTCSGCYECEDGYPNGDYPHSDVFGCTLGGGCGECGGLGAVWDTTDYAAMGEELASEMYREEASAFPRPPSESPNGKAQQ